VPTVVSTSYGTAVPPVADSVALTITSGGAFSAGIIRKFSTNTGNQIAQRPSANAAGGLATHRIRSRKMSFSVVLEDELIATKDFENLAFLNSSASISFTIGATQYNKVTWTAANVRFDEPKYSDDNGTQLITLTGGVYDSTPAANDAAVILFN